MTSFEDFTKEIKTSRSNKRNFNESSRKTRSMTCENRLTQHQSIWHNSTRILEYAFETVIMDDRKMYKMCRQKIQKAIASSNSQIVEQLNASEYRKTLTYGEVMPSSISQGIIPLLDIKNEDVFYDLGCGTGKIIVQVALETSCAAAKGIEIVGDRVDEGKKAIKRLEMINLTGITKRIAITQGDICKPPSGFTIEDATLIFINNVCFGPELMNMILEYLHKLEKVRRIITLRKLCTRHSEKLCSKKFCSQFQHPPLETTVEVTWTHNTTAYLYTHKSN